MGSRWIPLTLLSVGAIALIAALVSISVGENTVERFRLEETGEVQELIAGIRQLDDRLGPEDAPVMIELFTDIQIPSGAGYQAEVVDPLIEEYVRTGEANITLRHFPLGPKPVTDGGIAAEAAGFQARQWQFAELYMRNLELAPEQGVNADFLNEVAAVVPKLDVGLWEEDFEAGEAEARAAEDERLAAEGTFPAGPVVIVSGAGGVQQLEEGPTLAEVETAIAAVG
ncbi:MAG: DsbA family protein [Actinomycetota bacterium]|nr:DsbA family protein [Actinomycetota bacterium]